MSTPDIIIIGGGLSGLMAAWRTLDVNPDITALILEASGDFAGDHTWSFNESDIAPHLRDWLAPFVAFNWGAYDVKFPKRNRTLDIKYCTGNSDSLRACVAPLIKSGRLKIRTGASVKSAGASHIELEDGECLTATCVLDASGFTPNPKKYLGYQKFVGRVIKTNAPHGLERPIIMDATVDQLDGYRFVYCLPFTNTEILVEDTYYADDAGLSENEVSARLDDYIRAHGWEDHVLLRQEKGVLPITLAVDAAYSSNVSEENDAPVQLGMVGGYYHAVTGYSLPEAVKSAEVIAQTIAKNSPNFAGPLLHEMIYHKVDHYREEKFLRLLNRMLFGAAKPEKRYKVLERFYGLSEGLVSRFYRNRLTKFDKLRLLIGKPPVPIHKAVANLNEAAFISRQSVSKDTFL